MPLNVLVLNAGSSTLKCVLYALPDSLPETPLEPIWDAFLDGVKLVVKTQTARLEAALPAFDPAQSMPRILETLSEGKTRVLGDKSEIHLVGHRVVHGGERYTEPTLITPEVKAVMGKLSSLAPAHNPAALAGIEAAEASLGAVPQVAVFDTAFHRTLPESAAVYPVPYAWTEEGVRRYGFHGISHAYAAARAAELMGRPPESLNLITCHLGNGCSLTAVAGGKSVDTTMGFTPLEGLMMGTRSGSVDPGLLVYLMTEKGYSADELSRALHKQSGLEGVSGISSDMRDVSAAADAGHKRAQLALDVYIHRVRRMAGAMLASLGGLDAFVFTGGIGENSARVRRSVCEAFAFLGAALEPTRNEASPPDADISTEDAAVRTLIIHAQENWAIAKSCAALERG